MSFIDILKKIFNQNIEFSVRPKEVLEQGGIQKVPDKIIVPKRSEPQPKFLSACKDIPFQSDYEAYFKNGILFNVNPRNKKISLYEDRQTAYHARYIISDGIRYDLENVEDIKNIHIPKYNLNRGMCTPTMNLDYILKMRVGCENRPDLAVPLAYKTANLMIASYIGWNKKDFYRLPIQLWSIGEINYGDYLLSELKKYIPFVNAENEVEYLWKNSFDEAIKYAKEINTDYLIVGHIGAICPKCAPYQNRIYSISGKDKRFPKLPDFIITNKGLHCNVPIDAHFYYNGETLIKYAYKSDGTFSEKEIDAIKYSNRPFIDDRSEAEKQIYADFTSKRSKEKELEEQYYSREHWLDKYYQHLEYQNIKDTLGEIAPKSFSGYMRMKKNNTKNFQKLAELAKEKNIVIQ